VLVEIYIIGCVTCKYINGSTCQKNFPNVISDSWSVFCLILIILKKIYLTKVLARTDANFLSHLTTIMLSYVKNGQMQNTMNCRIDTIKLLQ